MDWSVIDNSILDPDWYGDRSTYLRVFKALRDEDPVHWTENDKFGRHHWTLTRYSDISEYLLDDALFSSRWDTRVPPTPKRRTPEVRHDQGWDVSIATLDDPLHHVYRQPVNRHFSAPAVGKLRGMVGDVVDEVLAGIEPLSECDFVDKVAVEIPLQVVMRLLGVPAEDARQLRIATSQWRTPADPRWIVDGDAAATYESGLSEVLDYCTGLARERRANPKDDFASVIAHMRIDGEELSPHEVKTWFSVIIAAGLENTRNSIAVGTWLFLSSPSQKDLVLRDRTLMRGAVDEVLRWVTPSRTRLRICNRDTEFRGRQMHAGDWVIGILGSANMDERQFIDPASFRVERNPNPHLSFGSGVHGCLGRNLARLELETVFAKLFQAFPELALANGGEPAWIHDVNATGISELPVRLRVSE